MRFKYLTATMLREAANAILAGEQEFMCHAIRDIIGHDARAEFEQILDEMQVSKMGYLRYFVSPHDKYQVVGFEGRSFEEDARFTRAFFLHMLADAIAYKTPKRKKFDGSNKLFSENPSEPGVYAVVTFRGITHYSKWDGNIWFMTAEPASRAKKMNTKSYDIYQNQYSHWINTKLL